MIKTPLRRLQILLESVFEGTCSDADREELDSLIQERSKLASRFIEQLEVHSLLQWQCDESKVASLQSAWSETRSSASQRRTRSVVKDSIVLLAVATVIAASVATVAAATDAIDFRTEWRFSRGDIQGAEASEFDDASWSVVRVPHDWAIAGPFDAKLDGSSGKLPWRGVGWYRKTFVLDQEPDDRVYLDFDGAMAFPRVYVNGQLAGEWDYGYTSFRINATPFINRKGKNVVAVQLDTRKHGTRWYPGAGLYRKVELTVERPAHIGHWGVYVTTPKVAKDSAEIQVRATIENHLGKSTPAEIEFAVMSPENNSVAAAHDSQSVTLDPGANEIDRTIRIEKPQLWDVESPHLYALRTTLRVHGSVSDSVDTPFGIRTFRFTADDGFHLNGRRVQLFGVNLHHDLGPLGAAFNVRAMQRQLEIMKEMGVNAVRTSHNPPAAEMLDLCDRMGIVVWDECFDKWNETAGRHNGTPSHKAHAERHLRSMVLRDRNHPSVIAWSIGNEIAADKEGVTPERIKMMCDVVRKYDPTRPVGLGCHIPEHSDTKLFDALDFTGWNYGRRYARYRERYPDRPIIYSESASALSTRGFYELPLANTKTEYSREHQVSSYDFNAAPWSDIADAEFQLMRDDGFVAGEFVWTGFDYLGEPTPYEQRAKSSYFGIVDLCGIPKDRYFLYRSYWRPDQPTVHVLPHWNWPESVGKPVPVFVYTNGDSAELFLNGKSLGTRSKGTEPHRPTNLALGQRTLASSHDPNHPPQEAADESTTTRWYAASDDVDQWWQVDLDDPQKLKCFIIEFDREAKHFGYTIQTSLDGKLWEDLVVQQASETPRWGGPHTSVHHVDGVARFVRAVFTELPRRTAAGMREFAAYSEPAESAYYDPTYTYRLRWNDVNYEPGELKAIAYKDGNPIGTAVMRTAGRPAAIRLTPDRVRLSASGDDLCYLLVEAVDEVGTACPLADNDIRFGIEGPAEMAAVGNGDPLSLESFHAERQRLFFGKAMLIVRTLAGQVGSVKVVATSKGLPTAQVSLEVLPTSSK